MVSLALVVVLAAAPKPASSIEEVWRRLPTTGSACTEEELSFDYGVEGGLRNFYCRARTVLTWERFTALAGVAPFLSGPHRVTGPVLTSDDGFGHYDPAFVRWATRALIPAAGNEPLRKATQRTYDTQVRSLARTWFRVSRVVFADKQWLLATRREYLGATLRGQGGWTNPALSAFETLLGDADTQWGGADPNLVRSATAWWLRRSADETADLWREGLERLLTTYDAAWLKAQQATRPRRPEPLEQ